MACDSMNSGSGSENGGFLRFSEKVGKANNLVFRSFQPFFRAIRGIRDPVILAAALALSACGTTRPETASARPPESRVARVAAPAIPPATTPCAFDAHQFCNTDAETAGVIAGYDAALGEANRRLCWLAVYFGYAGCVAESPSSGAR
jgi:hypothetical protein